MITLKADNLFSRIMRNAVADNRQPASRHLSPFTLPPSPFTFHPSHPRRGFTLVELLVVIAMLMLLAGAVTSSVASAQRRAKIAQATAETQEMTNAILAYEHFGDDYKLPNYNNTPATEANMAFILGDVTVNGQKVPVLYNASIKGGEIRDPWGRPYYVTIKEGKPISSESDRSDQLTSYVAFPNFNRRPADN